MQLPKYSIQEAKIIDAYMSNDLDPYNNIFCMCGILTDFENSWKQERHQSNFKDRHPYTANEYLRIESSLFFGIFEIDKEYRNPPSPDALFNGMLKGLEVLKNIHQEKGEIIDIPVTPEKRILCQI